MLFFTILNGKLFFLIKLIIVNFVQNTIYDKTKYR